MAQTQGTSQGTRRTPWHVWLVGVIGLLWNLMGVMSFMLTQLNVEAVMSEFPPEQRAYFQSFPWWADACWAIGVFGGVIGCLLLLLRKRLASPVLLAGMIGTAVCHLAGLFLLGGLKVMREPSDLALNIFPVVFAGFLAWYAWAMSKRGALR